MPDFREFFLKNDAARACGGSVKLYYCGGSRKNRVSDFSMQTALPLQTGNLTPIGNCHLTPIGNCHLTPIGNCHLTPIGNCNLTPIELRQYFFKPKTRT